MAGHSMDKTASEAESLHSEVSDTQQEDKRGEFDISAAQGARLGICKWFNVAKGWGFITPTDGGQDVFVHQSVIQMSGFRSLGESEEVEFECKPSERGLEATRVSGPQKSDCHGSTFRPHGKKRYRKVRCYNCGEFANHIASKCAQAPQPKRCHQCKSESHLIANCPKKLDKIKTSEPGQEHDEGEDSDASTSFEHIV